MVTIKSYTDLEQSKKLAEILPIESADMYWWYLGKRCHIEAIDDGNFNEEEDIRSWSLAALLSVIPGGQVNRMAGSNKWEASSWNDSDYEPAYYVEDYDNPVDACVAMIERLHELKIL